MGRTEPSTPTPRRPPDTFRTVVIDPFDALPCEPDRRMGLARPPRNAHDRPRSPLSPPLEPTNGLEPPSSRPFRNHSFAEKGLPGAPRHGRSVSKGVGEALFQDHDRRLRPPVRPFATVDSVAKGLSTRLGVKKWLSTHLPEVVSKPLVVSKGPRRRARERAHGFRTAFRGPSRSTSRLVRPCSRPSPTVSTAPNTL